MVNMIFVNLPVTDLARSLAFYKAIGGEQNMQFSDDTAAMVSFSEAINVMLLTHDKFRQFTPKPIADPKEWAQVLLAIGCESREEVDQMTQNALAAGGSEVHAAEDYGWMYSRAFADPDGHGWGPLWMDVAARAEAMEAGA